MGLIVILLNNPIEKYTPVRAYQISASREAYFHPAKNAITPRNINSFWSPSALNGKGQWIRIQFIGPVKISAVTIHGGAHSMINKNIYRDFNRIRKGELELSNGTKIPFSLEDKDELQRIIFKETEIRWIKLTVLSVRKGEKQNTLCVSAFWPERRIPYFEKINEEAEIEDEKTDKTVKF